MRQDFAGHAERCARVVVGLLKDKDRRLLLALHAALAALVPTCLSFHAFVDVCSSFVAGDKALAVNAQVELLLVLQEVLFVCHDNHSVCLFPGACSLFYIRCWSVAV